MRRKIAAGNWKLNGSLAFADELLDALQVPQNDGVEVLVFPPAAYLAGEGSVLTVLFHGALDRGRTRLPMFQRITSQVAFEPEKGSAQLVAMRGARGPGLAAEALLTRMKPPCNTLALPYFFVS